MQDVSDTLKGAVKGSGNGNVGNQHTLKLGGKRLDEGVRF